MSRVSISHRADILALTWSPWLPSHYLKSALGSGPWISRPGLTAKNVMEDITLCVKYHEYG